MEVLKLWARFTYYVPIGHDQIMDHALWLNSNIRIGNRPVLYTIMSGQGFDKIKDIVDEEGAFIEWEVIKRKLDGPMAFTKYMGLIQAIPYQWKLEIRQLSTAS